MSNAMKYIKDLEAAGFARNQAEAQVQMVLDAIEGDLATKSDLSILKHDIVTEISSVKTEISFIKNDLFSFKKDVASSIERLESRFERRLLETEFRLITRLGFLVVSTTTIAVAVLTWLIKI